MLRVIIVEDENIIREGLSVTLDWPALQCTLVGTAANGKEGLALIRATKPDIVITDIRMPEMSGLQMAEMAQAEGFQVAFIFLTGYDDFKYVRQALRLRAVDYLLKPIDEEELVNVISEIVTAKNVSVAPAVQLFDCRHYLEDANLNIYVRQTLNYIKREYKEKINVEIIADKLNVSSSYLSRKIKEATQSTFGEILTKYRLQEAVKLLYMGKYRNYEIAYLTGFGDYKNFCTAFKKQFSMSPKEYIKQNKKNEERE